MTTLTTLTVATFAVGVTQLVKDLGVQGQWLKLVCFVAGAFAWGLMTYYPAAWEQLSAFLIAISVTGIVSFGDERLQRMKDPS